MEYRSLGAAGIKISTICLGTWEWGGTDGWGSGDLDEYGKMFDSAIDAGINFIDTAEGYGKSEEILGKVIKERRDKVVLASKVSGYQWGYDAMRSSLERSLERLQTDYVDIYQVHWPKIKGRGRCMVGMDDRDYIDIQSSMEGLKEEGLIRTGGVSNFRLHHLQKFQDDAFEVVFSDQVPYSLLWRAYDDPSTVAFCKSKRLKYLSYSSLAAGLLSGKYEKESSLAYAQRANVLFNEPVQTRARKVVGVVKDIAKELDVAPSQVALRWVIDNDLIASAIVGTRKVKNFEENVEAANIHLTKEHAGRLEQASRVFWSSMPAGLEMWIWDNNQTDLDKIGVRSDFELSV